MGCVFVDVAHASCQPVAAGPISSCCACTRRSCGILLPMAFWGRVTKTVGSKPYSATYADGTDAGNYESIRQAQRTIELTAGGKLLVWTQVAVGDTTIESYEGND